MQFILSVTKLLLTGKHLLLGHNFIVNKIYYLVFTLAVTDRATAKLPTLLIGFYRYVKTNKQGKQKNANFNYEFYL